jgi:ABC-type multidrug transport system fused ATPase/permease subunit
MTIKQNIIYNEKNVTMDQVTKAAEKANALNFIMNNQFEENNNEGN